MRSHCHRGYTGDSGSKRPHGCSDLPRTRIWNLRLRRPTPYVSVRPTDQLPSARRDTKHRCAHAHTHTHTQTHQPELFFSAARAHPHAPRYLTPATHVLRSGLLGTRRTWSHCHRGYAYFPKPPSTWSVTQGAISSQRPQLRGMWSSYILCAIY